MVSFSGNPLPAQKGCSVCRYIALQTTQNCMITGVDRFGSIISNVFSPTPEERLVCNQFHSLFTALKYKIRSTKSVKTFRPDLLKTNRRKKPSSKSKLKPTGFSLSGQWAHDRCFMKNLIVSITILFLMFSLSACGSEATPAAESVISDVYTSVAATFSAQVTPTVASSATRLPDDTPTATLQPSPTQISQSATPQLVNWYWPTVSNYGCEDATLLKSISIPDETVLAPGEEFVKTWKFQNSGTCTWNSNFYLTFVKGDDMDGDDTIIDEKVYVDKKAEVSLSLIAPDDEGSYIGYWRMADKNGNVFGDLAHVSIIVVENTATYTPTATATFTQTPTSTATWTPSPAPSATATSAPSNTSAPSLTPQPTLTARPGATSTSLPTASPTIPANTATATSVPAYTQTPLPSETPTDISTDTSTETPTTVPTEVPTAIPTGVPTETPGLTPDA